MVWITFVISAVVIVLSGIKLTKYADALGDQLHFGKVWIGIILLGFVTSLPEAVTSLAAVISVQSTDLAIGNLLGSNNFNPLLIAVMDIAYRQGSITNAIPFNKSHNVSAFFVVVMSLAVLGEIMFPLPSILWFSLASIFIVLFYFLGIKKLASVGTDADPAQKQVKDNIPSSKIWIVLFFCAVFIVIGALGLTKSAEQIAHITGWGRTFVGSILLALVTSLPEMVVTLSALRLGALDLAVGNIFGSNMTNLLIIFLCDCFTDMPILSNVSISNILPLFVSIVLVGIIVIGLRIRSKKTFLGLGIDSICMIVCFLIGVGFLYQLN